VSWNFKALPETVLETPQFIFCSRVTGGAALNALGAILCAGGAVLCAHGIKSLCAYLSIHAV